MMLKIKWNKSIIVAVKLNQWNMRVMWINLTLSCLIFLMTFLDLTYVNADNIAPNIITHALLGLINLWNILQI